MRAGLVAGPRRIEVVGVPEPEPGPGEVRVRLEGCGVCGSDLARFEGRPWFDYPGEAGAPGHEGWGRVEAVGARVEGLPVGTRVAALSYRAYAEYDVADARAVVPLPDDLADEPFPGEPLGCAINVFRRSDIRAGQTVAVVGVGFLGALLVQLAAAAGARVVALSRRAAAREAAMTMGADEILPLSSANERSESCDRVIEAGGKQDTLDAASSLVRERGRLIVAGFHQDGRRTVDMQSWNWRGIDVVNAHERDQELYLEGIREAVRARMESRLDPRPLYTHRFPLDGLEDAFETALERPDGFMKGLVIP
jgi:threonine dehydrogenase-like Zn-dependent dehydrogenase